jgi:hypothetical protein
MSLLSAVAGLVSLELLCVPIEVSNANLPAVLDA